MIFVCREQTPSSIGQIQPVNVEGDPFRTEGTMEQGAPKLTISGTRDTTRYRARTQVGQMTLGSTIDEHGETQCFSDIPFCDAV